MILKNIIISLLCITSFSVRAQFSVDSSSVEAVETRKAELDSSIDNKNVNKAKQVLNSSKERLQNRTFSPSASDFSMGGKPFDPSVSEDGYNYGSEISSNDVNNSSDILYLFVFIKLQEDGQVIVNEHIKLGRNSAYKNGFKRSFPMFYFDTNGEKINNSINVLTASFNGNEVTFDKKIDGDEIVLDIHYNPDYFVADVNHINFSYRLADGMTFNKDTTELFWQVIGSGWDKRILSLGASVLFVKGMEVVEKIAFISDKPEQALFKVATDEDGNIGFLADRIIEPNESFSLYIKWKGDVVNPMTSFFQSEVILEKYGLGISFIVVLLMLTTYFITIFCFIGKDKEFFIKRAHVLRSLSPTALRYIFKGRFDNKIATVSMLDMIVKSSGSISDDNGNLSINNNISNKKKISGIAKFLQKKMFKKKQLSLTLDKQGKAVLKNITKSLPFLAILEKEMFFIKQNIKFIFIAFLLSAIGLFGGAVMANYSLYITMLGSSLIVGGFFFVFAVYLFMKVFKRIKLAVLSQVVKIVIIMIISGFMLCLGWQKIASLLSYYLSILIVVVPIVTLLFHIGFKNSKASKKYVQDSLMNLQKLLVVNQDGIAEKVLWNNFDKNLPYAVAIDMEIDYNNKYFGRAETDKHKIDYLPASYSLGADVVPTISFKLTEALN